MFHVIVNPSSKSGLGLKKWKELKRYLQNYKITYIVHFSKSTEDIVHYTRGITDKQLYQHNALMNRLIVLGGDDTLNAVVNGIDDFEHTIITYLPSGTSNDLARSLHLNTESSEVVRSLRRKIKTKYTDIGILSCGSHQQKFVVSSGIGYDASVCREALKYRYKDFLNQIRLGKLTYMIIGLKQLLSLRPVSCVLYLDDQKPLHFNRVIFASFMQQPYEGGGFQFCPDASSADGLLDICIAENISKPRALFLLPLAYIGKHTGQKGIHIFRASKVRIVTSRPLPVHTDGEICGMYSELTITTSIVEKLNYQI